MAAPGYVKGARDTGQAPLVLASNLVPCWGLDHVKTCADQKRVEYFFSQGQRMQHVAHRRREENRIRPG